MRISDWSSDVCSSDLCQSPRSSKQLKLTTLPARFHQTLMRTTTPCFRGCGIRAAMMGMQYDRRMRSTAPKLKKHKKWPENRSQMHLPRPAKRERKNDVQGKSVTVSVDIGGGRR